MEQRSLLTTTGPGDLSGNGVKPQGALDTLQQAKPAFLSDLLETRHKLWKVALADRLYDAPIESWLRRPETMDRPSSQGSHPALHTQPLVLDVGSGDCRWAADFARLHPDAIVFAVDITTEQVPRNLPSNCIFVPANFNKSWDSSMPCFGQLDYVHTRDLGSSIPHLRAFIKSAYAALQPGGIFEMQDFDEPKKMGPGQSHSLDQVRWAIEDDLEENGISWYNVPRYRRCLEDAGFEPAMENCQLVPTNPDWHSDEATNKQREMGALYQHMIDGGLLESQYRACSPRTQRWSTSELNRIIAGAKKEMLDNNLKIAYQLKTVWGRKPSGSRGDEVSDGDLSTRDISMLKRTIGLLNSKL